MIDNFIAYLGASYIKGLTVPIIDVYKWQDTLWPTGAHVTSMNEVKSQYGLVTISL